MGRNTMSNQVNSLNGDLSRNDVREVHRLTRSQSLLLTWMHCTRLANPAMLGYLVIRAGSAQYLRASKSSMKGFLDCRDIHGTDKPSAPTVDIIREESLLQYECTHFELAPFTWNWTNSLRACSYTTHNI